MATTLIWQRTRDNQLVEFLPVLTTTGVCNGLEFDGAFLWVSDASGNLAQIDTRPFAVLKTQATTPVETYDDIAFDGEYFWGPVSGNAGIAQWDRSGTRVNFIASITPQGPTGITFDGEYLWLHYPNAFLGTSTFIQVDRSTLQIARQFSIGLIVQGLTFDGEFLITRYLGSGTRDIVYIDRSGNIVRQVTGEVTGSDRNGIAFDGEFIYTLASV